MWALIDGNEGTGTFGALEERLDPQAASKPRGSPAIVPTWIPAMAAIGIGGWAVVRAKDEDPRAPAALLGLLYALFFLPRQDGAHSGLPI